MSDSDRPILRARRRDDRAPRWLLIVALALGLATLVACVVLYFAYTGRDSRPTTGIGVQIQAYRRAVENNPTDYVARRNLAYSLQQAGRKREAIAEYSKVLSAYPDDLASLYSVGMIRLASWIPGEGERDLLRVLKLAPTHSLAAKALGEYYIDNRRYEEALSVLIPAADAHPDLADLQELAGEAYEKTGQVELAARRYEAALKYVPSMTAAKEGLSRVGGNR
jgi:tetratricopeptide (TPR) repeat protein